MTRKPKKTNGSAKSEPRRRGELQDRVVAQLRRGLMAGAFVPGQTISLRKLAENLGTSPMPVREAINQLTAANVLEMLPNRTLRVPRMTPARFAELSRVRQALEGLAAEMACRNASASLLARLGKINTELLRAIKARDILGCLAKNQAFHFSLYEAANSEVLMPLIETLWLQAGPIMYFSLVSPDMPWDASVHGSILDALATKDPLTVRRAVERDVRNTASYLLKSSVFQGVSGPIAGLRAELSLDI